ncbi:MULTISPECIES: CBS domain-containing protein [Bacillaceae]|uniref:CBS domain-containing protein n=1 Tax=Bacillaceae TaxID=186817 RepID=UPI001BDED076|nr:MULTISPECIES: CBS domain-containing protein [Bacillaceae]MDX8359849.1 CBS domain-containing protein [Cytobacillus sp. IB215316]
MFVKSLLIPKSKCISVAHDESIQTALKKLNDHQIDALPIVMNESYVGTLTRYQIYESYFQSTYSKEEFLSKTTASELATHQDTYLEGEEVFEKTLVQLKDFPLLAVVDEDKTFLGIVTRYDVLKQFQSAFGMQKPGVRIAFSSVETEGRIARLAEIARSFHEHIISLVTFDETDKLVRRIVMKIEKKDNIDKFVAKLEQSGFRVLDIYED